MKYVPLLVLFIILFPLFILNLIFEYARATHTVGASPAGGTYNESQFITLESSATDATIYYTIDGSDPTTSSLVFSGPIEIGEDTVLKFMAVDPIDSHSSEIVSETYVIDTLPPTVVSTDPASDETRVDPRSIVSVTFSEPMDESTINSDSFTIADSSGNPVSGTVTYEANTNTASFTPVEFDRDCSDCLNLGKNYTATLDENIRDVAGNALGADFSFSFRTGGAYTIIIGDVETGEAIPNPAAFTITPDPFDLEGSLFITDNDENDLDTVFF